MPVLTIRLKEGRLETVLATVTVSFGPNPGEQAVLERLADLFERQPLGGKRALADYTNVATARPNATALQSLRNGASASIDIPTEIRSSPLPSASTQPADATYQRIVDAMRERLIIAGCNIGGRDMNLASFTNAIEELIIAIQEQKDSLHQEQLRNVGEVSKLNGEVKDLTSKLEDCNGQLDDFKSRNAQLSGALEVSKQDKQRLNEELQRAKDVLSQQPSRDVVAPLESCIEEGAV